MHLSRLHLLIEELNSRKNFLLEVPEQQLLIELADFLTFIKNKFSDLLDLYKEEDQDYQEKLTLKVVNESKSLFDSLEAFQDYSNKMEIATLPTKEKIEATKEILKALAKNHHDHEDYITNHNEVIGDFIKPFLDFSSNQMNTEDEFDLINRKFREVVDRSRNLMKALELHKQNHPFWIYDRLKTKVDQINIDYSKYSHWSILDLVYRSMVYRQEDIDYLSGMSKTKTPATDEIVETILLDVSTITHRMKGNVNLDIPIKFALNRYKQRKQLYDFKEFTQTDDETKLLKDEAFYNREICRYLHDHGFNPLSEITRGNTRQDISSESAANFDFILELKLYKQNHQLDRFSKHISQLIAYCTREEADEGYLVIMLRCKKMYNTPSHIKLNDKVIHIFFIDVRDTEHTGSGEDNIIVFTEEDIFNKLKN
ncbi:MAG: hypothetical protein HeimC2_13820 [Candidatus Heimdallarchaeota archaeon LC_2]|nr:MAG: hypothetical protein HeimC2_13820 [Candidatus Heimdallarchaeota archaeon LC_2]